jgi:hypothetical protein
MRFCAARFLMLCFLAVPAFAQDSSDPPQPFDVFSDVTGQPPADPSYSPTSVDIYLGPGPNDPGPNTPGPGIPGPNGGLPGLIRRSIPGLRAPGNDPCDGQGSRATDRQVFELAVYQGVCASDGVSPGTSRVCADLPAVGMYQRRKTPCLLEPPRSAGVWQTVGNCAYSNLVVQSSSVANGPVQFGRSLTPRTACQTKVIQATCADVLRAMNRPPFSALYAYFMTPPGVVPTPAADMNAQYNRANYLLRMPGDMPVGVPGQSGEINPLIQFGLMVRYCRSLPPSLNKLVPATGAKPSPGPCTDLPDSAWPPLAALNEFLNKAASHYDLTKSGEGLRLIEDAYINLGFGWLLKGAGLGLQAALGRLAPAAAESAGVWSWGSVKNMGYMPIRPVQLPPGVAAPPAVANTLRPIYEQELSYSCGPACIKMVAQTVLRRSLPEATYRTMCETGPAALTGVDDALAALRKVGVNANLARGQKLSDLAAATQNGYPAIVHVGPSQAGHALVVDAVVKDAAGNEFVLARDSWNFSKMTPEDRAALQASGFGNYPVLRAEDFLGKGGWGGTAIYTKP